jgi:hypothetical protein
MQVTDHHFKTVAFLCFDIERDPGVVERTPVGSAFFVLVQEEPDIALGYVVTARHCIEGAAGRPIYLRVNVAGSFDDIETTPDQWICHDSADVAIAPFLASRPGGYNLNALGLNEFVDSDYRFQTEGATWTGVTTGNLTPTNFIGVQAGHEVFFVGLFVQHYGNKENLPVARFGQIARMPVEPVWFERPDGTYAEQLAYLVECRSWGGFSGSPVYWRHPSVLLVPLNLPPDAPYDVQKLSKNGRILIQSPDAEVSALLGLVSGHFDIKQKAMVEGDIQGSITTAINSGIAVVTPAEAIRELLMREDVVEERKEVAKVDKPKGVITQDAAADGSVSREQFLNDLTRATARRDDEPEKEQS